jgi:surface polysaccharide O-acyltransferase-like enzyme
LTPTTILGGVLAGPYFHFWFMYLILGLYLITPLIRVFVAHANWSTVKYFLVIWFAGTAIVPLLDLYEILFPQAIWFRQTVFFFSGMLGYFLLGAYAFRLKVRSRLLMPILALSIAWTIVGTYIVVGTLGESLSNFFYDASSFSIVISSIALFLLLTAIPAESIANRFPRGNKVIRLISNNTLPIYLFHIMILEALQKGYLGVKISLTTLNPIIEIPAITIITLIICLAILIPLKKIPYVKRLIG